MILFNVINRIYVFINYFKFPFSDFFRSVLLIPKAQPVKIKDSYIPPKRSSRWMLIVPLVLLLGAEYSQAQVKYEYGFSIATGLYAAEGFGTNLSGALRFNKYFDQGKSFVEGSIGIASLESEVLKAIGNTHLFDNTRLFSLEFLYGYDPKMWTSLPYFTAGVASISQGGQSRFAGILGIGNRLYFDTLFGSKKMGLRYDLRDHIFSQSYNDRSAFISHNLNFTINLEFFF